MSRRPLGKEIELEETFVDGEEITEFTGEFAFLAMEFEHGSKSLYRGGQEFKNDYEYYLYMKHYWISKAGLPGYSIDKPGGPTLEEQIASSIYHTVMYKFDNKELREKLVATYGRKLICGNYHDSDVGVLPDGTGKNQLGKALMDWRKMHYRESLGYINQAEGLWDWKEKSCACKCQSEKMHDYKRLEDKYKGNEKEIEAHIVRHLRWVANQIESGRYPKIYGASVPVEDVPFSNPDGWKNLMQHFEVTLSNPWPG